MSLSLFSMRVSFVSGGLLGSDAGVDMERDRGELACIGDTNRLRCLVGCTGGDVCMQTEAAGVCSIESEVWHSLLASPFLGNESIGL